MAGTAKAAAKVAAGGGPENPVADVAAIKAMGSTRKKPIKPTTGGGSKLLLTEFLVCFVVLGTGTIVAPTGSKDGIPRLMTRGTGLCLLFLILSLIGSSGPRAAKAAGALGGLVTVSYLVLSADAVNVFRWATVFFSPPAGPALGATSAAASGAGTAADDAAASAALIAQGLGSSAQSQVGTLPPAGGIR